MAVNISGLPQITSNKAKGPRYMNTISFIEKLGIIRQRAGQFYDLPVGMLLILFSLIFYIYGQIPLSTGHRTKCIWVEIEKKRKGL